MPTVARELLHRLLDDAALFPPGSATMPAATAGHVAHRGAWYADLVGPLLCPASRLPELAARLDADAGPPIEVAVVGDTGTGGLADAVAVVVRGSRTTLAGLELPLRGEPLVDAARRAALAIRAAADLAGTDVPAAIELPRSEGWEKALDAVAEEGLRAKLRTGGLTADAFPTEQEVAGFLVACVDREVPVKCTAGLHRAIRHTAADTGFEHHGFLNLLLATAAARRGDEPTAVAEVLADRDADRLTAWAAALSSAEAAQLRSRLLSYGTCSVREPVDDLVALGLLPQGGEAA